MVSRKVLDDAFGDQRLFCKLMMLLVIEDSRMLKTFWIVRIFPINN